MKSQISDFPQMLNAECDTGSYISAYKGIRNASNEDYYSFVSHYSFTPEKTVVHSTIAFNQFLAALALWEKKYFVAKNIVRALRRNAKYAELVSDYNLGDISKDEFKLAASNFAAAFRTLSPAEILKECEITMDITGDESLGSDELGAMLDIDPMQLELTLDNRESYSPSTQSRQPSIA